jgi:hypothetical protein
MKCIKKGEQIKRVSEKEVDKFIDDGWAYCSKKEWKEKDRPR